ncbi:hypothetical protein SESBI_11541 [Sesbania bispinosa]|nr:hypothetical protein SESBI_11541 [Sesbania bispinosa]
MSSSKETHPSSLDTELSSEDDSSSSSFSSLLDDNPASDVNQILVVTINDSEETESGFENLSEDDRNVAIFKTYKTFTTEVYSYNSEYTTLPAIERFHRSTPVSGPASKQLIILDPCQKDELIYLSMPGQGSSAPFTYMGSGSMSNLLVDKMPPKADVPRVLVNEKSMRRWLKKAGGDLGAQSFENQSAVSTNERRKKQKLDVHGDTQSKKNVANEEQPVKVTPTACQPQASINPHTAKKQAGAHASLGAQGPSSSLLPPLADKWWTLFNNFEGPEDGQVNSIFDRRFNVEQVVAQEFNKKEDRSQVNKVGMRNVGKHLMTMGMQTAFFGYCFDNGLNSVEKELKHRALKIQELIEKLKATESSTQTITSLEQSLLDVKTKLTAAENEKKAADVKYAQLEAEHSTTTAEHVKLKKDLDDVVAEKKKLGQDLSEAIEQKKQLAEDKAKLDVDLDALQKEIAIQHARGFHKAIDQVKVLNPIMDVEGFGVFKKIVEGRLVDESEDDEE